ncbi:four helix bundle protein [Candidatus Gottesmanbacteria bacterium]|nr:four helix bundle protein [Candidatus Gottesmanbacteria bacterium]
MSYPVDIHDRIFRFVTRGLKVLPFLPKTIESKIIIDQYARSLTSVGANDNEADGVSTRNDFIHVYTTVRKELKEARYWLRIIADIFPLLAPRLINLIQESEELIRIISTIIANTKKNQK